MYNLAKFSGDQFARLNTIIDSYNNIQKSHINLLACVSYLFPEITVAMQYPFCTIPTEGVVSNRYFPLGSYKDELENIAEELTLHLFNIKSGYKVNIQPHSGTQANHIVYNSILDVNDKVLSLKPSNGGHISHTKIFNGNIEIVYYALNEKNEIDYDSIEKLTNQYKPKLIIVGGSSYPRKINYKKVAEIASICNAYVLADISHMALFIAGGIHENIFPYVDFATFTMEKNLRGPHGGIVIYKEEFHRKVCQSVFPCTQGSPIQNMMFGKVTALQILNNINIKSYAKKVVANAKTIAKTFIDNGINIITGGTDSHIVLVDVGELDITGKYAEELLLNHNILVNRNLIPNDTRPPLISSGIRIGSTPITNLNYTKSDIVKLTKLLISLLKIGSCDENELKTLIFKYNSVFNISS